MPLIHCRSQWWGKSHAVEQYGRRQRDRDHRPQKRKLQRILVRHVADECRGRHIAEQVEDENVGGQGSGAHMRSTESMTAAFSGPVFKSSKNSATKMPTIMGRPLANKATHIAGIPNPRLTADTR